MIRFFNKVKVVALNLKENSCFFLNWVYKGLHLEYKQHSWDPIYLKQSGNYQNSIVASLAFILFYS